MPLLFECCAEIILTSFLPLLLFWFLEMSHCECLVVVRAFRFLQFVQIKGCGRKGQLVLSEYSKGFSSGKEKKKEE